MEQEHRPVVVTERAAEAARDADTALAPAQQQALEPADDRNPLIPLPAHQPAQTWQETADTIVRLRAESKPPFPHCGAPSILDDSNLLAHLFSAIDDGLSPTQAATALGIRPQAITRWLQRAEAEPENDALSLFSAAVKSAQDRRRRRLLGNIEEAGFKGPQYWTAHAWLLERGYGNDYKLAQDRTGGGVVIQIGVKDSEVTVNAGLTDNDLRLP